METKIIDIKYGNNTLFNGPKPIICPHCGAFTDPSVIYSASHSSNNNSTVFFVSYRGQCCNNTFFTIYEVKTGIGTLLTVYPPEKSKEFPEAIQSISPHFINLYNQAHFGEQNNLLELAGAGYRNAMEVLVKDYAISELNKTHEEVTNKKLYDAILEYTPSIRIPSTADVARVLGNDFTHYENKYEDIDFDILKRYIHILVNNIENEYLLNHPVVPTNKKPSVE